MSAPVSKGRRRFLIAAGAAGGGLAVGSWWFYRKRDLLPAPDSLVAGENEAIFNAWIKIDTGGRVVVQVPRQEMGQGITTALPMLVAEELDVDLAAVAFEQAPIAAVYGNATMFGEGVPYRPDDDSWVAQFARLTQFKLGRVLGLQGTGGSSSVRDAWEPMRRAGATARAMLVSAAAARLGVDEGELEVRGGAVVHAASQRSLAFGDLAAEASRLPMPREVRLKDRSEFTILGTPQPRLDVPGKVDGSAEFGLDVRPDGMVYAAVRQAPTLGGGIRRVDSNDASEMPGVRAIIELPGTSMTNAGIAVVADHYWQAKKALDEVRVEWDDGPHAGHDTGEQRRRFAAMLDEEPGRAYDEAGDVRQAFASADTTVEASYYAPYLAHATMEPLNCTAVVRADDTAEVWVANQGPPLVRMVVGKVAGIDAERVAVHTPYLGGGFGRRAEMDVVMQAAQIANQLRDTPVQVVWSREEDIRHDVYRPMGAASMRAAIGADGRLEGLEARVVGQSCMYGIVGRLMPGMESDLMKDRTVAEGLFDLPYGVPNRHVAHVMAFEPVPVGYWRSVGHSHNAYFAEAFIDECAEAAGQDPYEFRRALLAHAPRHHRVLETAASKAGWGKPLPAGVGRGIAFAESFGSLVAQVAEVELIDGRVRVRRVVCAVDCGFAVNPDTVEAQMESGILFGLTAALYGEITISGGRVQQSNFPDYPMVRLADAPAIEVHVLESGIEHLGGIGEPGTPPIAPAVANAVYALTGKRVRELPIRV
ncbi:MAG: molybdopterin cofactor-binding domain-containing protein [Gammaproteobacteria bacterium]